MITRDEHKAIDTIMQRIKSEVYLTIAEKVMENNDAIQFAEPFFIRDITETDWLNVAAITYSEDEDGQLNWFVWTEIEYHYGGSEVNEALPLSDFTFEEQMDILDNIFKQEDRT